MNFKTRVIELPSIGKVTFAQDEAIEQLYDSPEGEFISKEAEEWYQNIFFFLEDDEWEMSDKELLAYTVNYILV